MYPNMAISPEETERVVASIRTTLGGFQLRENHYLLGGSAILALRGIREARDLDVFVSRAEYARLARDPRWIEVRDPWCPRLWALAKDGTEINAYDQL